MKRYLMVLAAAAVLAAGLTGIAVANSQAESELTGMTGCLSAAGDLSDLDIGQAPLTPCAPGTKQVSVPVLQTTTPKQAPSLNCVVEKGTVSWDKSGLWAEFDIEWTNISDSKVVVRWEADQPLPSGPVDNSLSEATGDWSYAFNDSTSVGFTLNSQAGHGTAKLHLGSANPSTSGTTPISALILFPPDGSFFCVLGK